MAAILRITDGSTYVNLLRQRGRHGFHLSSWEPQVSVYKGGGIWHDSPFSDGRRLIDAQWTHPIENIVVVLVDPELDDNIERLQDLRRLLEKANNYWMTSWQNEPVWIEAQGGCETNLRYALIYDARIVGDNNPYAQSFASSRKPIQRDLTIQVERGHWLSHEPTTDTCVELSSQQLDWQVTTGWTINTAQPTSSGPIISFPYSSGARMVRGDSGGVIWYTSTAVAPWSSTNLPQASNTKAFAYSSLSGRLYSAGNIINTGYTHYSTDGGASWAAYAASGPGTNTMNSLMYDQDANTLWLASGSITGAGAGGRIWKSTAGSGAWTQVLATAFGCWFVYKTRVVMQETGDPYYIVSASRIGSPTHALYTLPLPPDQYGGTFPDEYITYGPSTAIGDMAESSVSGLIIGIRSGQVIGSANGTDWETLFTGNTGDAWHIIESSTGELYIADDDQVFFSSNGGYNWQSASLVGAGSVYSLAEYGESYGGDGHIYGTDVGDTWESDTRSDMGQSAVCDNYNFITNSRSELNLTHLFVDDGGVFSVNQIPMAGTFDLLPDPAAADDAVYFGIEADRQDNGDPPFDNLVFDLDTIMIAGTSVSLIWEYYDGAAWSTLTVADHTEAITHPFELAGIRSVHWVPPADWTVTTVNTVDALWVRCRVTAIAGGTVDVPSQQNVDVYTTIWPRVDIDELQVPGDITNIARHRITMQSDGGDEAPELYANRVIVGLRSMDRGEDFTAYLNCADEQNPISVNCSLGANTSFVDWIDAAPGRASHYQPTGYDGMAMRVRFELSSTLAQQYHGSYRAFLRCTQRAGSSGDLRTRLYIGTPWGSDDYWSDVKSIPDTITYNKLIDFGEITLPLSQLVSDEAIATTRIEVHAQCTFTGAAAVMATLGTWMSSRIVAPYDTAPQEGVNPTDLDHHLTAQLWYDGATLVGDFPSLYFLDLILIPSDEWIGDFVDEALSLSTQLSAGRVFEVDSTTYPKTEMRGVVRNIATDAVQAVYVPMTPGPVILQPNADQRLWFLFDRSSSLYTPDWNSSPHIGASVQSYRVSRYLQMRGSR